MQQFLRLTEVANLCGSNPWTPLIGPVVTSQHTSTAILCGEISLGYTILLAYTVSVQDDAVRCGSRRLP